MGFQILLTGAERRVFDAMPDLTVGVCGFRGEPCMPGRQIHPPGLGKVTSVMCRILRTGFGAFEGSRASWPSDLPAVRSSVGSGGLVKSKIPCLADLALLPYAPASLIASANAAAVADAGACDVAVFFRGILSGFASAATLLRVRLGPLSPRLPWRTCGIDWVRGCERGNGVGSGGKERGG